MDVLCKAVLISIITVTLLCCLTMLISAEHEVVYLGDRKDLMKPRDYEDSIGWNTAHSGEKLTIWDLAFEKGIGMHCRQYGEAYIEFDISELEMNYFYATVGVLKDASYYIAEGNISFRVYGDGKLLATTPAIAWNQKPYYICVPVSGVKTLKIVEDNAGTWVCDAGIWGDCALSKEEPTAPEWWTKLDPNNTDRLQEEEWVSGDYAYISDLYFRKYTDVANCRDVNIAGEKIVSFDGKYFPKGIGLHSDNGGYVRYIEVNIEGLGFTKFASYYGISQTVTSHDISMANIKFAIFGDGKKLFESGPVKYETPMKYMECDITGVKILRLAIAPNPRIDGSWGTWGGAIISKSGNITDDMMYTDYFAGLEEPSSTPTPTEILTELPETTVPESDPTENVTKVPESTHITKPENTTVKVALASIGVIALGAVAFFVIKKRKRG